MGEEATSVLLEDTGDSLSKIREESQNRLKRVQGLESKFEAEDNVQLEFDLTTKESPMMNGMLTLVSVATFLAGFVAADFSGFSGEDWEDFHWICKCLYVCMLAYSEGSCLYIAICGTMACATHLRAANQMEPWENMCHVALEPVVENLSHLKGQRLKTIKTVLADVIRSNPDFVNNLAAAGFEDPEKIQAMIFLHQKPGSSGYLVNVHDPVSQMGLHFGFRYLRNLTFPIAIVCYLFAQTLKALKGEPKHIVVAVVAILAFWLLKMSLDLRSMYKKIYD